MKTAGRKILQGNNEVADNINKLIEQLVVANALYSNSSSVGLMLYSLFPHPYDTKSNVP